MNILSFDIEEWFCYQRHSGSKEYWLPIIDRILNTILEKLEQCNMKATFFCLGIIAREYPEVINRIISKGHEIACHSDRHIWLSDFTPETFNADTKLAIDSLQQITGKKVNGYRAPAFSIGIYNKWAVEILVENGIQYDCSIFPSSRDFGGFPGFEKQEPTFIKYKNAIIKEFPMGTIKIFSKQIAYSGGGYFRIIPYGIIGNAVRKSTYVMTYFHIRDFDVQQKKDYGKRYFKDYLGINGAYQKFGRLLDEFDFVNVETADKMIHWEKRTTIIL